MEKKEYYLGLDIGTDSVGYAATDKEYSLLKYRGKHVWGVTLFDAASLNDERRALRVGRRSLKRREWRVSLIQELFAEEIYKIDPRFFIRQSESGLWRDEAEEPYSIFNDKGYTDKDYHKKYPTIHHLITDLMYSDKPHDIRLVYLACAWLVAHRGHFLSDLNKDNVAELTSFENVYQAMREYILQQDPDVVIPWNETDLSGLADILQKKLSITKKTREVIALLFGDKKIQKTYEGFPFGAEALIKALCGAKVKVSDLFQDDSYESLGSFSLGMKEEDLDELIGALGDDAELIAHMKAIYDWSLLINVISGEKTISEAKVKIYEQHKQDLAALKVFVRKYIPESYNKVFRECLADNYQAYAYHTSKKSQPLPKSKADKVTFSDALKKLVKGIEVGEEDKPFYNDMMDRLETYTFLPKQKDGDNRVIPYQLYWVELKAILAKAEAYLPFLSEKDKDGLSVSDKILSVLEFRIPYFVGPLQKTNTNHAWVVREKEKVYPWNFEKVVDLDASEKGFIDGMLNRCTYLPDEYVLPMGSLLYHRFMVLNEINNLKVDGVPITVEAKQHLYNELFMKFRKVTVKQFKDSLKANGYMKDGQTLSGVDEKIKSDLKPWIDFSRLMRTKALTEEQVEDIIRRITYTEDKHRLKINLKKAYPELPQADVDYICRLGYKDFGRLSARLLNGFEGTDRTTGEVTTIIRAMWETNQNFMELMSDRYTFAADLKKAQEDWYQGKAMTLDERLDDMWISNAVKRPILQALKIVREVVKAEQGAPEKIFVEVTRGATDEQKNQRTISRKDQILALYDKCKDEDVRILKQQLEAMGDAADNKLRGDALFLYYMQLGRCMYTGEAIPLEQIKSTAYNIDHIYPQSVITDNSPMNNMVLVKSEANGQKTNHYPIAKEIREARHDFWAYLHSIGLMTDEKYRRLTRNTPFTDDEKMQFISRQLTQTSQSVKAVAELLKEMYPDTEIVYTKARLTSEFRNEFDLLKSRTFNDLHHAKDAYLNIVTGNVYNMKFTSRWFSINEEYSVKPKTLFTHPVICGKEVVWDGNLMLERAKKVCHLNDAHMTCYAFCRHGGLFDRQPLKAAPGLVNRKSGLKSERYGGYAKPAISYFMLAKFWCGKKTDVMIVPVQLMSGEDILKDEMTAINYIKDRIEQIRGKQVDRVELPLGLRKLKINTMLELDGFRACVAGVTKEGKSLILKSFMPFSASYETEKYIKRLERLCEKTKQNAKYVFDNDYDKVCKEENEKLYDLYLRKLTSTIFVKRNNSEAPANTLYSGRAVFCNLSETDQAEALVNIHSLFGRIAGGIDLHLVGGGKTAGATNNFSGILSNWEKTYHEVRIVDSSVSGLWEETSANLFDFL